MATMTIGNPSTKLTGLENASYQRTKNQRINQQVSSHLQQSHPQQSQKHFKRDSVQFGSVGQPSITTYNPSIIKNNYNKVSTSSTSVLSGIQGNEQLKSVSDDASVKLSFLNTQSSGGLSSLSFSIKGDNFEFNLDLKMKRTDSLQLITVYNDKNKNGKFNWKALKELLGRFEEKSQFGFTVNLEVPLTKKEVIQKHFFGQDISKYKQWKVDYNQSIVASLVVNQSSSQNGNSVNDSKNLVRISDTHSNNKGKKVGHTNHLDTATTTDIKSTDMPSEKVVAKPDKTPKEHQNTNPQASFNRTA